MPDFRHSINALINYKATGDLNEPYNVIYWKKWMCNGWR